MLDIMGSFIAIILVLISIKKLGIKIELGIIRDALKRLEESAVYFVSTWQQRLLEH